MYYTHFHKLSIFLKIICMQEAVVCDKTSRRLGAMLLTDQWIHSNWSIEMLVYYNFTVMKYEPTRLKCWPDPNYC